jgi:uncharacterized phage-associated protein
MNAAYSASTIANWFTAWSYEEYKVEMTALKLQKLLAYAQQHYLAETGAPLFDDELQAWDLGPVVPEVYKVTAGLKTIPIPSNEVFAWDDVDIDVANFLVRVWNKYGLIKDSRLVELSHYETPWLKAYNDSSRVITVESMLEYVK